MPDQNGQTPRRRFLATCATAAAAGLTAGTGWAASPDAQFAATANRYITRHLELSPERATRAGEHRYDGRLQDRSAAGRERLLAHHRDFLKGLEAVDPAKLSTGARVDYETVKVRAEEAVWNDTVLRDFEWDPLQYNPGNSIYLLLERDFAPLPGRLESARARLDAIPEFLAAAKKNLKDPPAIFTETAISQNKGTLGVVRDQVSEKAAKVPGAQAKIAASQQRAAAALEEYGQWLERELAPRSRRDPRLGAELFQAKLRLALDSDLSAAEVVKRARAELEKAGQAIYETAAMLAKQWSPSADVSVRAKVVRLVLDKLAQQRPTGEDVIAKAEREVQETTRFVNSRGLVTVPATPVQVVPMPEFQRGVAVASCASPGPLEKRGQTFLNISPPPESWNAARVESYFREYNDWMLKDLIVHEGMPGHYLQAAHANRYRGSTMVRTMFRSGSFVEGWAVYAERLMADHGFGGPEVRMQQLKMWLRTVINALLDAGIHTQGMTEQQAMDLMMNQGFQEESEAAGKWRRANLSSAQLSTYFVGASELYEFRTGYEQRHGPIRDWKAFHDRMLSFGAPAPRYLRQLMA